MCTIGRYSRNAFRAREASTSTRFSVYRSSVRISPGYQLFSVSWSSHWLISGTSAYRSRTFWSSRLYLYRPRYSASVSATLETSSVTTFFQTVPSATFTVAWIGPSA